MSTPWLIAVPALVLASLLGYLLFWIVVDARERALQRRREAEMADALTRSVRQARIPARDTAPNRYLSDDERNPE